ncbi:MAG: glycosyltransferase [Lachnospiraceae bacterium]|nr:glycosyltransferase [Lachnospiraceae bacterium]
MDALILSCGTGGGHNSAGIAILEEMEKRGHHVTMLNPYTLKSKKLSSGIDRTYISMAQRAPDAFGAVYKIGNLYRRLPFRSPVYFANHVMDTVMEEYFAEHPVDIVLMPHLFPAEILTNMKLHGLQIPKTMFIATDYVCIPFTEETECDAYVVPAKDLEDHFTEKGIPGDKLYPLGIPTGNRFMAEESCEQAKKRLGLDADKNYILVAGGSMGGGKIRQMINVLCDHFAGQKDVELLVICGSNQALFQKLSEQRMPGVTLIDYTDDMEGYMRASQLFITKPGGLSSTEAAVRNVPILHTAAIPGCESYNARYFSRHGMSVWARDPEEVIRFAEELLRDKAARQHMISNQQQYINSRAAADICDLAEKLY